MRGGWALVTLTAMSDSPDTVSVDVDVASYRENGFLIVEDLVSAEDVERLRAEAVKICRGGYPTASLPELGPEVTDREALGRYLCIHQPHKVSPVIREALAYPGIASVLSRIIGPDVKCMQSMLFIKPPRYPGQAWHQDEIYIPTRDRSLTGGWIALDDATVENGCLWVLPGSHRSGVLYPQRPHGDTVEFDSASESWGFDDADEIPVEVKAGAVVFFNGYLLHRSRKNRSEGYRRVLVNHYMSAQSLLPWHAADSAGTSAAMADYRDIILVAGQDPYAWKGTEERAHVHSRAFDPAAIVEPPGEGRPAAAEKRSG